ncbi:MAG: tetratricopeptide repeat protein [Chloroflexota bacterium]
MKKVIVFLIGALIAFDTFANVNNINISKICADSKCLSAFNDIKDNQQLYDHWTNEWKFDTPKEVVQIKLREYFTTFSSITPKNEELFLLLGDIAHYLYNLDDTAYFSKAVNNYNLAIKSNPKGYRAYWFLGFHYALSNVPTLAIENFLKAQELLPADQPADFWNEYAMATAITNMPSHCIYAMDQVKRISGVAGSFETQLGPTIHKRIVEIDKEMSYPKEDLWSISKGEKIVFTSRPLGIKILVDPKWKLSIYDYNKRQSAFIINPPAIKNKKGKEINYTVALMMKSANDNDQLVEYINNFVSNSPDKSKISFSEKYPHMIAYEIKDKSMYQDIGGGHLYMIGIERNTPTYPGLLLENPATLPDGKAGQVNYYNADNSKNRFNGKIFYMIMLDSCEDIHDQSLAIFKALFDNQIIIE